jgi:hypothetical protein
MPKLPNRKPLSPSEIEEFFQTHGHLNYRYTMLWRHKTAVDTKAKIDYGDAICAYESALIECRVLMEFLGLGVTYATGSPVLVERHDYFSFDGSRTDEVKAVDVGGTFAKLSRLSSSERRLLSTVYHMAHKATAHFTFGSDHMEDPSILHKCIPVIDRLLHENLYDLVGKKPHQQTK